MGRNCGITSFVSHLDCFQCLRYGTDLVQFDKDGISCTQFDTFCKSLGIGNEEIIANQLYFISQSCSEFLPAFPVFLIQTILDGNDRVFLAEFCPVLNKLLGSILGSCFRKFVEAFAFLALPLRRCRIHSDLEVFARLVASFLYCLQNGLDCFFIGLQCRSKSTFVTYGSSQSALF